MTIENRVYSFDTIKCVAAFLVVSLHTPSLPIPLISSFIPDVARIAVPLFLMISGYLTFSFDHLILKKTIQKSLRKSFRLLIFSIFFYLFVDIYAFQNLNYLKEQFHLFLSLDFWFFGTVPYTPVSWYLVAYIYSLLLYFFFKKINLNDKLFVLVIIIFLLIWLISGSYQSFFFSKTIPWQYNTSWIMALPFFLIGTFFRKFESKIHEFNWSNIYLIILILAFILFSFLEHILIKKITNTSVNGTGYFSTCFLAVLLFTLCLKNKEFGKTSIWNKIGKDYSLYIFIFHVAFSYIICRIFLVHYSAYYENIQSYEPLVLLPFKYQYFINNISIFIIACFFSVFFVKSGINTKIGI